MTQIVICIALAAFILREWQHNRQTKDLLNRLMARDYSEYTYSKSERTPAPSRNFVLESLQKAHQSRMNEFDQID